MLCQEELPTLDQVKVKFIDDDTDEESDAHEPATVEAGKESTELTVPEISPSEASHIPKNLPNSSQPSQISPRRSSRLSEKKTSYRGMNALSDVIPSSFECEVVEMSAMSTLFDCLPACLLSSSLDLTAAKSFNKATSGPEGEKWMQACRKEIQAMVDRGVWELVPRPPNTNIICGLWLFRKKLQADGSTIKFKA